MAFCKHRVMDKCKKDNMPCIYSKECCEPEVKKTTNADRIRNMTDEELAEFLTGEVNTVVNCGDCDEPESEYGSCIGDCKNPYLKWLQAEVKEG